LSRREPEYPTRICYFGLAVPSLEPSASERDRFYQSHLDKAVPASEKRSATAVGVALEFITKAAKIPEFIAMLLGSNDEQIPGYKKPTKRQIEKAKGDPLVGPPRFLFRRLCTEGLVRAWFSDFSDCSWVEEEEIVERKEHILSKFGLPEDSKLDTHVRAFGGKYCCLCRKNHSEPSLREHCVKVHNGGIDNEASDQAEREHKEFKKSRREALLDDQKNIEEEQCGSFTRVPDAQSGNSGCNRANQRFFCWECEETYAANIGEMTTHAAQHEQDQYIRRFRIKTGVNQGKYKVYDPESAATALRNSELVSLWIPPSAVPVEGAEGKFCCRICKKGRYTLCPPTGAKNIGKTLAQNARRLIECEEKCRRKTASKS